MKRLLFLPIIALLLTGLFACENATGPDPEPAPTTETLTGQVPYQPAKVSHDSVYYSLSFHTTNPDRVTSIHVDSTRDWWQCENFKARVTFTIAKPHIAKEIKMLTHEQCGLE